MTTPLSQTQTAIVTPVEDGFDVAVASQDITQIQAAVAMAMAVPANSVNVTVRRLGGSYGGKITLPNHVSDGRATMRVNFFAHRLLLLQLWQPTR